jgi:hypothetical protein
LLLIVSGWVHRRQLIVIEFRQAENRLLKDLATASAYPEKQGCAFTERFTPQGLCFPSQQRPLSLGKSMLLPDSHRRLVGQKWDFSKRWAPGRPGIMREMSQLIVRMAARVAGEGRPHVWEAGVQQLTRCFPGPIRHTRCIEVIDPLSKGIRTLALTSAAACWQNSGTVAK